MTLADLQSRLARLVGTSAITDDPVFSSWSVDVLNDSMDKIATALQIPRNRISIPGVTASFAVPADMQTWGLLAVTDTTNGNPLAIVDAARGMARYAPPPIASIPAAAVYEPSNPNVDILPNAAAPISVDVLYAVYPDQLVNPTDEPFNGTYREYHYIVALGAALLVHEGDWADIQRVDWVRKRYEQELEEFTRRVNAFHKAKPRSEVEIDPQRA